MQEFAVGMSGFRHKNPFSKGIPFFLFMTFGTYTLALFIQTRHDIVVRSHFAVLKHGMVSRAVYARLPTGATNIDSKKLVSCSCINALALALLVRGAFLRVFVPWIVLHGFPKCSNDVNRNNKLCTSLNRTNAPVCWVSVRTTCNESLSLPELRLLIKQETVVTWRQGHQFPQTALFYYIWDHLLVPWGYTYPLEVLESIFAGYG